LILLIVILPFTRFVVGTTIGSTATVVPLVVAAAPFIARLVESSLKEVDGGVVEAAVAMGARPVQIIGKVLLPEARSSLLLGVAISLTSILGYSAMAGIVGGGGLGDIAIRYGYYRYQTDAMLTTASLLAIIVQFFQEIGARLARRLDKRMK
jgi:D-methionine transport system permease protein